MNEDANWSACPRDEPEEISPGDVIERNVFQAPVAAPCCGPGHAREKVEHLAPRALFSRSPVEYAILSISPLQRVRRSARQDAPEP